MKAKGGRSDGTLAFRGVSQLANLASFRSSQARGLAFRHGSIPLSQSGRKDSFFYFFLAIVVVVTVVIVVGSIALAGGLASLAAGAAGCHGGDDLVETLRKKKWDEVANFARNKHSIVIPQ
jgi:hypothetical protein